jgi:L-asparaginase II
MEPWTVEQRRGQALEAKHAVHACAVDREGRTLWQVGEDLRTTFRSAAKPFQLEVSWELLSDPQKSQLLPADLAIGSGSHHGEAFHIAQLTQLLDRLSRTTQHLYCGAHDPVNPEAMHALYASGEAPNALHNNCAGKHAFMAAACATHGYPADYRPATHPLQRAIFERVRERALDRALSSVVDGCGVPCFVLPLSGMARCYAQLALESQGLGAAPSPLGRIGEALLAHARLMSGSHAFDGWLIEQAGVIAKVGAQGLLCMALPSQGIGIAVKIESGADAPRAPASHALLAHFMPGLVPELPPDYRELRNVVGDRVGELSVRR